MSLGIHTLVFYGASSRADATLRALVERASEQGGLLTVVALVVQEPESNRCCDTRSVQWNEVVRGLAGEDLSRARLAVEHDAAVEFGVLAFSGRRAAEAVIGEALARDADAILLADPRAVPIGALERRRLRRRSPVPVIENVAELSEPPASAAHV
jgi:hypothetical protein